MSEPLAYATPEYHRAKPSTVGFLLGLLGLGLIFLCGCFMIGIMIVQFARDFQGMPVYAASAGRTFFILILYVFAFSCFGGGAYVLRNSVKKLIQS